MCVCVCARRCRIPGKFGKADQERDVNFPFFRPSSCASSDLQVCAGCGEDKKTLLFFRDRHQPAAAADQDRQSSRPAELRANKIQTDLHFPGGKMCSKTSQHIICRWRDFFSLSLSLSGNVVCMYGIHFDNSK